MASELANIWWCLILLGLFAGVISGALGLGSGILLIPATVILFSFPQKSAQGMALAVMVPMALLGAFRYWKNPEIEVSLAVVGLMTVGALAGTLIGTELAARLPVVVLKRIFAVFLVIAALKMAIFPAGSKRPTGKAASQDKAALVQEGSEDGISADSP